MSAEYTVVEDSKPHGGNAEDRTLLSSTMTTRDVLLTPFSVIQWTASFIITFVLNFLIAYYSSEDTKCVLKDISCAVGSVLVSSFITPFIQLLLQHGGMQAWIDKERRENNLQVIDIEMLASSCACRPMFGVRAPRLVTRAFFFAVQAFLCCGVPCAIIMALACKGHTECALTRTEYGFLMGFFVAIQVVLTFPLIFAAALHDTFVTQRAAPQSSA